jgi:hypothetical protein
MQSRNIQVADLHQLGRKPPHLDSKRSCTSTRQCHALIRRAEDGSGRPARVSTDKSGTAQRLSVKDPVEVHLLRSSGSATLQIDISVSQGTLRVR